MNTTIPTETHEQFVKRMDIERTELGRELRDGNYKRAGVIAAHIANSILVRIRLTGENKQ